MISPCDEAIATRRRYFCAAAVFACSILQATCANGGIVRFQTSVGNVDVRLFDNLTPNSVDNFLGYVTTDRYDGTFIHRVPQTLNAQQQRVSSHFVVQGGGFKMNANIFQASGITTDPPIADEFHLSNIRGTLSFAKNNLGATSQWFFNIGNNSFLDAQGFTVFGRVVGNGMQVVDQIDNMPTVNASAAQNAAGEDFDEVPVFNVQKVVNQNNVLPEDAVMVTNVQLLSIPAGDYNFDGRVDLADYSIWRDSLGSTTDVRADGNGDGVVNAADYGVWKTTFGQLSPGTVLASTQVPEPKSIAIFLVLGSIAGLLYRAKKAGLE
jgi:peptidyl-prolyl cis-trans isomerase A (cyclophilin A)